LQYKAVLQIAGRDLQSQSFRSESGEPDAIDSPFSMSKKILISAGHTNIKGLDRGAAGLGYVEGVEAVLIRDAVAAKLRELGHTVVEDGFDGDNQPLTKALALVAGTDVAVEIHFNAFSKPAANGCEVLAKPAQAPIARRIAGAINASTGISLRGGDGGYKPSNSGQHHRLAFCERGGLIVEIGFITSVGDMTSYKNNFDAMCTALAAAIAG
jgi:N-acetylmuramoyl-L-alanine amidase